MDKEQKLAIAAGLTQESFRSPLAHHPKDRPLPPPRIIENLEAMTSQRRKLMAELYAEFLSDAQLLALEEHQNAAMTRSIADVMVRIHEEFKQRSEGLWGQGTRTERSSGGGVAMVMTTSSGNPASREQEAAVRRLIDGERLIENTHANLIRNYLKAIEAGATGSELALFYTSDAVQVEHPNRLNPTGGRSDLATMLSRAEQGKKLLSKQQYDVLSLLASGNKVSTEVLWTGTLAVPQGTLAAGAEMRAHIAMFFELEEGRIRMQRNYDCFEAWQ